MLTEVGLDQQSPDPQIIEWTDFGAMVQLLDIILIHIFIIIIKLLDTKQVTDIIRVYSTSYKYRYHINDVIQPLDIVQLLNIIQLLYIIQSLEIIHVLDIIKTLQKYNVLTTYKY